MTSKKRIFEKIIYENCLTASGVQNLKLHKNVEFSSLTGRYLNKKRDQ